MSNIVNRGIFVCTRLFFLVTPSRPKHWTEDPHQGYLQSAKNLNGDVRVFLVLYCFCDRKDYPRKVRASASGARMETMSPTNTLQGDILHWSRFVCLLNIYTGTPWRSRHRSQSAAVTLGLPKITHGSTHARNYSIFILFLALFVAMFCI